MKNLCLLLAFLITGKLAAQNTYVFTGSYNWDKQTTGIYVFQLDTVTGQLDTVLSYRGIANPSFIRLSSDGRVLYACTESKTPGAGSVSAFAFDPVQKTLRFINSQPSGGENPVYVNASGKWLVNANYTEGSLSVYPLKPDGSIAPMVQNIHFTERSINPERQDRSHVHAAMFSRDCKFVYFPDLGADIIRGYPFDSSAEQPLDTAGMISYRAVAGSGPRHLAFHPGGQYAYCTEEMAGYISVYKYDNKSGRLDSLQRISAHKGQQASGYESSDIHVSPDGRFLYAANRGKENNIAIYKIADDGRLHVIAYQSTYGQHPRNFTIDATGRFLIVANVVSGNIVVFKRNSKTGKLKMTGSAEHLKNPTSVQIKQY